MRKFFSDIWKSRSLITTWTRYNIEANYLDSKLGAFWIILQPIVETLVYATVFSLILTRKPRGDAPYVLFFLSGMVLWQFFSGTIMRSSTLMSSKINLISQIKFPNQTLIFVDFLEKLVDFAVALVILTILNIIFGYFPNSAYIYVPIIFFVFFVFTTGAMLILATLGAFVQDIPQITGLALRFFLYFSGVLISADMVPARFASLLNLNPLFFIIESFRNVILYADPPDPWLLLFWAAFSILFFFAGVLFFVKNDGSFADYQ